MKTIEELEERAWHRLLKVCYVLTYGICLLAVFLLARERLPKSYINDWDSTIQCFNGLSYPTGRNHIYPSNGELSHGEDVKARKLCAYDVIDDYADRYATPPEINYRLVPKSEERGGYSQTGQTFLWGLLIVILLGELVRRTYLYVVAGIPFFSGWNKLLAASSYAEALQGKDETGRQARIQTSNRIAVAFKSAGKRLILGIMAMWWVAGPVAIGEMVSEGNSSAADIAAISIFVCFIYAIGIWLWLTKGFTSIKSAFWNLALVLVFAAPAALIVGVWSGLTGQSLPPSMNGLMLGFPLLGIWLLEFLYSAKPSFETK